MKIRNLRAIAVKDLREVLANSSAWVPMLIVPLIFMVIFPLVFILVPGQVSSYSGSSAANLQEYLNRMPAWLQQQFAGLSPQSAIVLFILGYIFAPMFLVLPLIVSTTIAAESFAGERERKTIEALLYSAASDAELFTGKALAGLIPAVAISWVGFLLYTAVINIAGAPLFGRVWFPLAPWYPLVLWLTPAVALMGIAITVLISARVQTFMGAYQSSAASVLLVLGLLAGQATGLLIMGVSTVLLMGLIVWLADAVLLWFAVRTFNRARLLGGVG